MQRREFVRLLGGAVAAWSLPARAREPVVPVVGVLGASSSSENAPFTAEFVRGLNEAGFVEGRNVVIEYRWAEGRYDRLPTLADELVRKPVSVIFASGGQPSLRAAAAATTTIPIVFSLGSDPVSSGYVASLNRPGGNITGVNFLAAEIVGKRFELLRELVPNVTMTALLVNPSSPTSETEQRAVEAAARDIGQTVLVLNVSTAHDIEKAFATLAENRASRLLATTDAFILRQREQIVGLAARDAIPTAYFEREFVAIGGLMSYGTPVRGSYHQAGVYAGRILAGAKPADLPIVQPTKFELVFNLKTATALGLTVPDKMLALADEVIE
jgi:putative tryptophan/tyrosine transport system substrate-binding protein